MIAATRIESGPTMRAARVALQVGVDGELRAAVTTENSLVVPFGARPGFDGMASQGVVTVLTSIKMAAALHFDGDDIEWGVVVEAAGLGIEVETADFWSSQRHRVAQWQKQA